MTDDRMCACRCPPIVLTRLAHAGEGLRQALCGRHYLGAEWMLSAVQLADELKKYGLTLSNYASIREQSVGGFIQVDLFAVCFLSDSSSASSIPKLCLAAALSER